MHAGPATLWRLLPGDCLRGPGGSAGGLRERDSVAQATSWNLHYEGGYRAELQAELLRDSNRVCFVIVALQAQFTVLFLQVTPL